MIDTKTIEQRNQLLMWVCELTELAVDDVLSGSHKADMVLARNLVMWAMWSFYGCTTVNIGILMHKHYTSVVAAVKSINNDRRQEVKELKDKLLSKINETRDAN